MGNEWGREKSRRWETFSNMMKGAFEPREG